MQKGFSLILIFPVILLIIGAGIVGFYLGKNSVKLEQNEEIISTSLEITTPETSVISKPKNIDEWVSYRIEKLNLEFKLPPNLAKKYGQLTETEIEGGRGSELQIKFKNDPANLIMTAQSPEYIAVLPSSVPYEGGMDGPPLVIPSVFQGYKFENANFYGIESFGREQVIPIEDVTLYHTNGRDILKIKNLYGSFGMITQKKFTENSNQIWGLITNTGNKIYPGLTLEGILDNGLTEEIFEQILSTFQN